MIVGVRPTRVRRVLYLVPQLSLTPGGIQAVSEDTLRAVTRTWPDALHRVLLLGNRADPRPPDGVPPGVRYVPCGMRSRRLARLRFTAVFAWSLLRTRFDLVVVAHVDLGPLAWMARRLRGVPYVVWAHGIEVQGGRGPRRRLRLASLRGAERVIAVSRHTAGLLAAIDEGLAARTVVIPNAVGDRFKPGSAEAARRRLGLAGARVLLTVGRLSAAERYKGFDTVLRALPEVLRREPDIRYVIVGAGDDAPRLRGVAARLGVARAVVFAGAVPDRDLPDYYRACDLFVMPSRREGFGIVFIEALACGRPVIAGDSDGARDALRDGRLGRLLDPDDPHRLAGAVLDLLGGRWPRELTDPVRLRRECLAHFGFAVFDRRVRAVVRDLAPRSGVAPADPAGADAES